MINESYIAAGALTGLLVGMTGVGGGAILTPLLLLFFGVQPTTAIATDLWFAAITKMVGTAAHHVSGQIDWQVVRRMWLGSMPVALLTSILVSQENIIGKVDWLTGAIGMVVVVTGVGLIAAPQLLMRAKSRRLGDPVRFKAMQPALTVLAGAILGVCVTLTSIGAGALGSVALLYLYPLRMTPHRLVGTDLAHAIPLAVVAGVGYLLSGLVDGWMLVSLLLGSIPAIALGSALARIINGRLIQLMLGIVLVAAGLKTCF